MSYNKNVFDRNVYIYQTVLKNSGINGTMTYNDQSEQANNVIKEEPNQARNCKSAIIWYSLPYSMNVKTNTGKTFFKLVRKPTNPPRGGSRTNM